ncbi:MAG: lauroyl-Kdo(2)-lipid IV(A) myristoyltransferase [Enterobacteriaceae bacterium]
MSRHSSGSEFIPQFSPSFLLPRYWGIWLGVGLLALCAFIPARWRNPLLGRLGRFAGRLGKSARRRARINLLYCFPELTDAEREQIIDHMFASAVQTTVLLAEIGLRSPKRIEKRTQWLGEEHITAAHGANENVIFLVPHGWGIDIPAMLLAARGYKIAGMFHHQKNPLADWLWNRTRRRFGGRLHARQNGVKPFISSVRHGYWGYYLPDQDHGAEQSEFVDFFATYKATLPAIGRLMKVCRARVIPLFPVYDAKQDQLTIIIHPPMDGLDDADNVTIARRMNQEVEQLIGPHPEQYAWILKLLKTRRPGETEPYQRKDL